MTGNPARLARRLGYQFTDDALFHEALAHRSSGARNYERLEFLGDSLLSFVISSELFRLEPDLDEGALSRLRASLVRGATLAELAREIELGDYLTLGSGELKSGGFNRDSILADVVESIIGAVYIDGGLEAAKTLILSLYQQRLAHRPDVEALKDPKTRLQELLQSHGLPLPAYAVIKTTGESHCLEFTVSCELSGIEANATAKATSRRKAEQAAAASLLSTSADWLPDR